MNLLFGTVGLDFDNPMVVIALLWIFFGVVLQVVHSRMKDPVMGQKMKRGGTSILFSGIGLLILILLQPRATGNARNEWSDLGRPYNIVAFFSLFIGVLCWTGLVRSRVKDPAWGRVLKWVGTILIVAGVVFYVIAALQKNGLMR
jgi:hypothetical protein